ncbi:RNA dependent RNA polymerase-domain-containing protein [Suillus variegatus]|nr:RNA dependent RNA polymerase-domain-containing protein [Suillus variegatus]
MREWVWHRKFGEIHCLPRIGGSQSPSLSIPHVLVGPHLAADTYGVLEEGQIHFRSSELITDPESGARMNTVTGPVLVWRNPTRLPFDVQKVTAVSHPKLDKYFHVIVFPVKGERSLASYLGGGDYDGVTLVWSKRLVENFDTAPLCMAPAEFIERIFNLSPKEAQTAFQKALLLGLADTKIGLYSKFHDLAVYERGYASAAAIRLAYMFTTCLDASKTGLQVKRRVFEEDRKNNGKRKPYYMAALEQNTEGQEVSKRKGSTPYLLDALVDEGRRLRDDFLKQYSVLRSSSTSAADHDLTLPLKHMGSGKPPFLSRRRLQKGGGLAIQKSVKHFAQWPDSKKILFFSDEERKTIMASYAHTLSGSFGFSVAFAELCAIKTRAQGAVLFADRFAEVMCISNNTLRALSQAQDDADE